MENTQQQRSEMDKAYHYYRAHQDELASQYNGKYIIIYDNAVRGAYDDVEEAVQVGDSQYTPGEFMVKRCYSSDAEPKYRMMSALRRVDKPLQRLE
jgi:NDP-sugar pyrophosphorylase family protein